MLKIEVIVDGNDTTIRVLDENGQELIEGVDFEMTFIDLDE